jgi:CRISPR-associated RAMP protein (TIGR02581 family)
MLDTGVKFLPFDRLLQRHRIQGLLITETGIRVGAGKNLDVGASDQPVIRDGLGRLFLPGSSLKGVLRSGLESVLRGIDHPRLRACDLFAEPCTAAFDQRRKASRDAKFKIEEVLDTVCTVCGLFGSPYLAGRVFVADLPLAERAASRTEVRDGVGIDRDRRVAQTGPAIKYDHEVVPPGTAFRLEMILENVADGVQLGLVLKALDLLASGEIRLGGATSRGLGRVSLRDLRLERTDASRLIAGEGYEPRDYKAARKAAEAALAAILVPEKGA